MAFFHTRSIRNSASHEENTNLGENIYELHNYYAIMVYDENTNARLGASAPQ
ncbi:hypothetical protein IJG27_00550 [Candidatus Saccharibacteria bacterium]|nr:hypothetical protein [Candidatus Saccharibacteria bacterium]